MSNSPWSERTGTRNAVGAAWAKYLRGEGYGPAGDVRFLARFRASPYIQLILRYAALPPNSLILEPGCGSGKFSLALASLGHRVVVLDYVAGVLDGVRATEQRLRGQWPGQLRGYCQGSLERLPVHLDRDKRVAGVYSREVPWPEASPLEAARLHLRFPAQRCTFSPEERGEEDDGRPRPVIPFSNVASATRRELLLRFPFPELTYAEDKAWASMMLQRGYRLVYEPEARVYHSHDERLPAYYRRQFLIGRSKREVAGHPPSLWSIARTALGDLRGQVRFFRQILPAGQQAYWTVQGLLYSMTRIVAQTWGSRSQP